MIYSNSNSDYGVDTIAVHFKTQGFAVGQHSQTETFTVELLRNNACSSSWTNPTPSSSHYSLDTSTNPDRFVYTIGSDDLTIDWDYAANNNCDFTDSITINS